MPVPIYYLVRVALILACAAAKIIDLSHKHNSKAIMAIHGAPGYNLTNLERGTSLGIYVEFNYYGSSEHGGTHIDAPSHFVGGSNAMKIDEIPIEHTILEGVMIDVSKEAASNHNYAVDVQRLKDWESVHGKIPTEAGVLFYFGWYQKYDDESSYRGSTRVGNFLTYEFPHVTFEAGKWLLNERHIRALGSDTMSVDPFQINNKPSMFLIHVLILPENRILIENLRDLDKLPARGFRFHFSPVKYVGASGTQVRAYAMTYDAEENGANFAQTSLLLAIWCATLLVFFC